MLALPEQGYPFTRYASNSEFKKLDKFSCLHEPIKASIGEKLLASSSTGQQFPVERRVLLAVSAHQRRGYRCKNGECERGESPGDLVFAPAGAVLFVLFGLMYGKEYAPDG
jgi:hypothetical protein